MTKSENLKTAKYWLDGSKDDFVSARDIILKTSRYSSGVFFLHLSVEKKLKGLYVKKFKEHAPYTHNLSYLADRCGLQLSGPQAKLLTIVNEFNLSTRYPADKITSVKKFNKEYAKRWLKNVEIFLQFLDTY